MKIRKLPAEYKELGMEVRDPQAVIGKNFPDFMIIGPQRTGTTWLSELLRIHPQVQISGIKEPHYFANLVTKTWYKEVSRDFHWYLSLFEPKRYKRKAVIREWMRFRPMAFKLMMGEATASHAEQLTLPYISFLNEIAPKMKIIMGLRDPVERAWSHMKLVARTKGYDVQTTMQRIRENDPAMEYILRCSETKVLLEKWKSMIPADRLYLFQYRALMGNPQAALESICDFLDISRPTPNMLQKLEKKGKINATETTPIPHDVHLYLEEKLKYARAYHAGL